VVKAEKGGSMERPHFVAFDLETRCMADEVGGWDYLRKGKGGVSVIAVWDSRDRKIHFYDDHEDGDIVPHTIPVGTLDECIAHLESATIVVGYNSKGFDAPVIEGLIGRRLALREHIDLLELIWAAARLHVGGRLRGNKLGHIAKRTIGRDKIEDGAMAPQLAREGAWDRLFAYCADDTDITRELFEHVLEHGGVIDVNGHHLPLTLPSWLCHKE
jgi:hypothetical protein